MEEYSYQNRRDFLKYMVGTSAVLAGFPAISKEVMKRNNFVKLTILHTNDVHSRIEPFPLSDPKYPDMGGFARRSAVIESIRKENDNVLLLDAGDVFDLGIDNIAKQMPHANFSLINCNYDFSNTSLHKKIIPYKVFEKQGLKIGVLGYGIELEGLVDKKMYKDTVYQNPVPIANATAKHLKKDLACDYVIALSHIGFSYNEKKISDMNMAPLTENIDLIIGGHTHTFLEHPVQLKNKTGKDVYVTQVGWAGIWLGKIDVIFSLDTKNIIHNSDNKKI